MSGVGGLRKRRTPFVQVPGTTVDDTRLSYRALGVLTYLLNRPDGWDVRAEQLANDGKGAKKKTQKTGQPDPHAGREGREAVRTALRELGAAGYYRLERRRLRDGRVVMGTALSETPVTSWIEQNKVFKGAVPVVEQEDGSFLVRYPDGTLRPDDFPPPTGDGFPGSGTGDGFPGPGKPASGEPAPEKASPLQEERTKTSNKDGGNPSGSPRADAQTAVQPTLDGAEPAPPDGPSTRDIAFGIARGWIGYLTEQGTPPVMRGKADPLHALAKLIIPVLDAGYTENEIKHALSLTETALPSTQQLDREVRRVRSGVRAPGRRGRPTQADLRVNDRWEGASGGVVTGHTPAPAVAASARVPAQSGVAAW